MSQILLYSAFFIWGLQFNILVHLMSGVYTHFGGHESEVIRTFFLRAFFHEYQIYQLDDVNEQDRY